MCGRRARRPGGPSSDSSPSAVAAVVLGSAGLLVVALSALLFACVGMRWLSARISR
jgi:hypothetical protein